MAFGDFTVDRASKKYVLGSDGFLKEYANDEPAIEFNADGSYKGVLVEPAATNICKQSENFSTTWTANRITVTPNSTIAPDNTTTADLAEVTTAGVIRLSQIFTGLTAGDKYTFSCFAKKGTSGNTTFFMISNSGESVNDDRRFNFDTEVWSGSDSNYIDSVIATDYGNGWYRLEARCTIPAGQTTIKVNLLPGSDPTATTTGANVYLWGAQVEESPIATSYIPTTVSALPRVADDIYLTSASSLIGQTEGTLYCEFIFNTESDIFIITDGVNSITNYVGVFRLSNNLLFRIRYNSSGNINFTTSHSVGQRYKVAVAYKSGDSAVFVNGSQIGTTNTTAFSFSASLSYLEFLSRAFYVQPDDGAHNYRAVALYTTRLSDPECEALTAL